MSARTEADRVSAPREVPLVRIEPGLQVPHTFINPHARSALISSRKMHLLNKI